MPKSILCENKNYSYTWAHEPPLH